MTKTITYLAGSAIAALVCAAAGSASAADIDCPLSQARRTIVDTLPGGWWTTPQVNSLSETKIVTIGGQKALMCVYGGSGSIQRNAPPGMLCTTRPTGFRCTPMVFLPPVPPPSPPVTFSTGGVVVPQTYELNLDNGNVGGGSGADLWFQAVTSTERYLTPINGAMIAVGDRSNRGRNGCRVASFSSGRVPLSAVPVGSYICMKTNQGRTSQFRMNAITGLSVKTLEMGYTTWAN
ncbi:MAG: hypothetical protein EON95_15600 [Caulobacteraceae bacterium]|nr:hypothetical protein [Caulobacter sp.]RYF91116.1 MAG: hypothetical protein EON95_15600 [Caulobacteraceae bacterium]